jgi:hypothetical protein
MSLNRIKTCSTEVGSEQTNLSTYSLMITAHRKPCSRFVRMCSRRVVLPAPRKPDNIVTGKRLASSTAKEAIEDGGESAFWRLETDDAAVEVMGEYSDARICAGGAALC